MSYPGLAPQDAQSIPVFVQVIDMEPFSLELAVPSYLPARDLTQRIARDAGLGAYWEDGTRRNFYLRARGRLMEEEERLEDLGVVPYELVHLLPQPPEGSGVAERAPEYPPNRGYSGAGNLNVAGGLLLILLWTLAWSTGLTHSHKPVQMGLFPAMGLALLCTSFARHTWGGVGTAVKIPLTGLVIYNILLCIAILPSLVFGYVSFAEILLTTILAFVGGMLGVMLGWLAWYGAVEPLPKVTAKQVQEFVESVTYPCAICGGLVGQEQLAACKFACGKVFHNGCYRAKEAMAGGDSCSVCGFNPAA
jgi:hypothetical protein